MSDLVVTVPMGLWADWLAEGDLPGTPPTGEEWAYWCGTARPPIERGERLYIVAFNRLRGYAPVTRVARGESGRFGICRAAGAVAVSISERIKGFRGYRRVWWKREDELIFLNWLTGDCSEPCRFGRPVHKICCGVIEGHARGIV